MSDAAPPTAPQPLPESGWQRLWHLLGLPSRTPEQHAELKDLHDQAMAHAAAWRGDPEAVLLHVKTAFDNLSAILKGAVAQVPALSGLGTMLNNLDATLLRLHQATQPPAPPPEMPPAPEAPPPEPAPEVQDAGDSSSEPASDSGSSDSGAGSPDPDDASGGGGPAPDPADASANDLNKAEADANAAH